MLPNEIQKHLNKQKGSNREKVLNIKYMFMRDLHQPLSDINKMTVEETLCFLNRLEKDAKEEAKQLKKPIRRM